MGDMNQMGTAALPITVSRTGMIKRVTRGVLSNMSDADLADTEYVQGTIINACNDEIEAQNAILPKGRKWKSMHDLSAAQIADIMARKYHIALISTSENPMDDSQDVLAVYCEEGPLRGIYVESDSIMDKLMEEVAYDFPVRYYADVRRILRTRVPRKDLCRDRDLIAVNNGIFDYKNKVLLDFSPDLVFLSKSAVDYNPGASCVTIHNSDDGTDWDVDTWMDELSDDPDIVQLLWQILGAIIRPNVDWDKSAWFYSESGNNGKGTLCELMRQLCGGSSYVSLPLSDMGVDFKLEPLIHASAIIVDENDVGTFIDKAANLKAIITGDMLSINRKFKIPVTYRFRGFMVQCLNEMPKIRDKSDSFFRRQLFIPFEKCFTGAERKYIKHDYLHRTEVLEYVLYKVLHMDYYELVVPARCEEALNEYRLYADPVYAFLNEMMDQFVWDLLPWAFLYDLYCAWYKQNNQGNQGGLMGSTAFMKDVKLKVKKCHPEWSATDAQMRPGNRMSAPEPLIAEYDLQNWMNPLYLNSKDVDKKCIPVLGSKYRGLYRK